jgi:hypothetical protein
MLNLMKLLPGLVWVLCAAGAAAQATSFDAGLLARANGGDATAQVSAGEQFAKAAGANGDPDEAKEQWKKAAEWYRKAAEQGDVAGEIHLGDSYRDGRGVPRDQAQAAQWYQKAAEQGDAGAQGMLAMMYAFGQGLPQSDVDAYFWLDVAASVESPKQQQYIANRQNIGTRITADDLAEVERRVKKWKAEHKR